MSKVLATSVLVVLAASACATAGNVDAVKGGQLREGYDAAPPPAFDSGVVEQDDKSAPPTTWRGLYRDFFGRNARSGCAGNGTCHEAVGQTGVSVGSFLCPNVDTCWESMRSKIADGHLQSGLVDDGDVANPDGAHIFEVIRIKKADGTTAKNLNMPQQPADFAFTQDDIARMKAWIKNGANKD